VCGLGMISFAQNGNKKRIFVNFVFYIEANFWPLGEGQKLLTSTEIKVFMRTDGCTICDHKK
jgi:hypothetical protein